MNGQLSAEKESERKNPSLFTNIIIVMILSYHTYLAQLSNNLQILTANPHPSGDSESIQTFIHSTQ
jgi:hypothetical protein